MTERRDLTEAELGLAALPVGVFEPHVGLLQLVGVFQFVHILSKHRRLRHGFLEERQKRRRSRQNEKER